MLRKGDFIQSGEGLKSRNGLYTLLLRNNGNLEIFEGIEPDWQKVWESGTVQNETGMYKLHMQGDNNLVLRDSNSDAIWATHTENQGTENKGWATLKDDGDFILYGSEGEDGPVLWASQGEL